MKDQDIKILDCTFRDGGYYNNWDFTDEQIHSYLSAISKASVQYVELGFRSFSKPGFLGPFAYTTDSFLDTLELPAGPIYGVMIDAKTIISHPTPNPKAVKKLFSRSENSKIKLVRIAAHFSELEESESIAKTLSDLGYCVCINLMQSGGKEREVLTKAAKTISNWQTITCLYFADSLGNMDSQEVERVVTALKSEWKGDIGVHAHNNMSKAIENTLVAFHHGASWLDCTISGMGRGAGNAETENLLTTLSEMHLPVDPKPIYDLSIRHFEPMKRIHNWGSNLLYFLGAKNNIHPTYIQKLLSSDNYGVDEIVGAIDHLSTTNNSYSYDGAMLEEALGLSGGGTPTTEITYGNIKDIFKENEVLLLANGPSIKRYSKGISSYISSRKPTVISLNINQEIPEDLIDYFCIIHNAKFLSQKSLYSGISKPFILPLDRFNESEIDHFSKNKDTVSFGLAIKKGEFSVTDYGCSIPYELTFPYALGAAIAGGANKISLAGFDGFKKGDSRQEEMQDFLSILRHREEINLNSITPTNYSIEEISLYAPCD